MQKDGLTDRERNMTKLIVAFRKIAKATTNYMKLSRSIESSESLSCMFRQ
jgi:hypothetical protein